MSGVWGSQIKLSIFGESHGKGVGIVISGLPPGIRLDWEEVQREMARRAPGRNEMTTPRQEQDRFELLSGFFHDHTTGAPLAAVIWNQGQRSGDYEELKDVIRPGHADYTAGLRYKGFHDYRGGGHFSGRLTAPLVFAGALAKQILGQRTVIIGSHILRIAKIEEQPFDLVNIAEEQLHLLTASSFPVLNKEIGEKMKVAIQKAKEKKDSVGGIVETAVINIPGGIGSPFFEAVESKLAQLVFAIPAVKGLEFGQGFAITKMQGFEANDSFRINQNEIVTDTNHNGGILGGITNGMPIVFRTAFKPTPSIGKKQTTVNVLRREQVELEIAGRHDPCIVPRALPVVEAVTALALLDLMIEKDGTSWIT